MKSNFVAVHLLVVLPLLVCCAQKGGKPTLACLSGNCLASHANSINYLDVRTDFPDKSRQVQTSIQVNGRTPGTRLVKRGVNVIAEQVRRNNQSSPEGRNALQREFNGALHIRPGRFLPTVDDRAISPESNGCPLTSLFPSAWSTWRLNLRSTLLLVYLGVSPIDCRGLKGEMAATGPTPYIIHDTSQNNTP
ncbi:hypothetical protein SeLEV6574_g04314 [Synchytrium endobioticum]|uniref:Uncharacterized protein n=1 Tax=Synchytrium endobioticum TaxID=286115 RepID=A0A507D006_9FUNG|nr:hypothetical protein SeLEV6574_g04314 [Synchytrium endobioticum]